MTLRKIFRYSRLSNLHKEENIRDTGIESDRSKKDVASITQPAQSISQTFSSLAQSECTAPSAQL